MLPSYALILKSGTFVPCFIDYIMTMYSHEHVQNHESARCDVYYHVFTS
jgi:hypothetical protein